MCGIAGKLYFNQSKQVSREEILAMTGAIAHRGPNDEGVFVEHGVGLGHRRLSIIDLSPAGHQPMSDSAQNIWITFNGEIYNFQELKKKLAADGINFRSQTDTEVIIYLYKKYGPDCLKKLRGMFSFAVWDAEKQQLFIARDRLGKKPLKYYFDEKKFVFASELKAILTDKGIKREIDFSAIDEYLTYGYVPAPKTGLKKIWKLEPAHYLLVDASGKMEKHCYWNVDFAKKLNLNENEWEERITDKLKESVKLRLMAEVPLGVHLSGGVDSSLITALTAEESSTPVKTYSVGFGLQTDELKYARFVADRYHTEHHELIVNPDATSIIPKLAYHYEEPFADTSALPTWFLCQATKQDITVALNGDGGDEGFGGYDRYLAMHLYPLLQWVPFKTAFLFPPFPPKVRKLFENWSEDSLEFYFNITSLFSPIEKQMLYASDFARQAQTSRSLTFYQENFKATEKFSWVDKWLYMGVKTHLPDQLLAKVDIASMAHGLEIRSPLLDHELMELLAQAPSKLKLRGFSKKYLLKKIAYRYLPLECIERPKQGFDVPLEVWLKDKLTTLSEDRLLDKNFIALGFNEKYVCQLISKQASRKKNNAKKIWALVMLAEWSKRI